MDISTMTKLASRALSLGALALAILAISASTSLAQIPYATTLPSLPAPSGGFIVPEPVVAPGPDGMTVSIANGQFSLAPGTGLSITMLDDALVRQPIPSDVILFDNSGPGGTAMITFLSDDEQGNLPPINTAIVYTALDPVIEPKFAVVTIPITDLIGGGTFTLTATMFSDGDPTSANQLSDFMTLSVPEPSTVYLAGLGLATLAGMAYRRRRTRTTG